MILEAIDIVSTEGYKLKSMSYEMHVIAKFKKNRATSMIWKSLNTKWLSCY